eukprot:gene80-99_t
MNPEKNILIDQQQPSSIGRTLLNAMGSFMSKSKSSSVMALQLDNGVDLASSANKEKVSKPKSMGSLIKPSWKLLRTHIKFMEGIPKTKSDDTRTEEELKQLENDPFFYSPEDSTKLVDGHVNVTDLYILRATTSASPNVWTVMKAVYFLLYVYHEKRVVEDDECYGDEVLESIWELLRLQKLKCEFTPNTILNLIQWHHTRELLSRGPAVLHVMHSIVTDRVFHRTFPDDMVPRLKTVVFHESRKRIFYPDILGIGSDSTVAELCRWVRHVVALVFAAKKVQLKIEDQNRLTTHKARKKSTTIVTASVNDNDNNNNNNTVTEMGSHKKQTQTQPRKSIAGADATSTSTVTAASVKSSHRRGSVNIRMSVSRKSSTPDTTTATTTATSTSTTPAAATGSVRKFVRGVSTSSATASTSASILTSTAAHLLGRAESSSSSTSHQQHRASVYRNTGTVVPRPSVKASVKFQSQRLSVSQSQSQPLNTGGRGKGKGSQVSGTATTQRGKRGSYMPALADSRLIGLMRRGSFGDVAEKTFLMCCVDTVTADLRLLDVVLSLCQYNDVLNIQHVSLHPLDETLVNSVQTRLLDEYSNQQQLMTSHEPPQLHVHVYTPPPPIRTTPTSLLLKGGEGYCIDSHIHNHTTTTTSSTLLLLSDFLLTNNSSSSHYTGVDFVLVGRWPRGWSLLETGMGRGALQCDSDRNVMVARHDQRHHEGEEGWDKKEEGVTATHNTMDDHATVTMTVTAGTTSTDIIQWDPRDLLDITGVRLLVVVNMRLLPRSLSSHHPSSSTSSSSSITLSYVVAMRDENDGYVLEYVMSHARATDSVHILHLCDTSSGHNVSRSASLQKKYGGTGIPFRTAVSMDDPTYLVVGAEKYKGTDRDRKKSVVMSGVENHIHNHNHSGICLSEILMDHSGANFSLMFIHKTKM